MTTKLLQRPGKIALTISLLLPLIAGCTTTQAVDSASYSTATTQGSFSEAQLDSLLAPIALYPDTVLSHVLIASTYPLEVVEADRWKRNNPHLTGDNALNSVDGQDWDPSVKALVAFPEILKRMSDDLDWTQQLGDAFLANEEQVMDSIQKLRNRAYASGNLDKVEHVRVVREDKVIVIEPSVERVVYVPAYDTRVVYGNWWWADYPPVYWHYPSSYVFVSGFYWGPRVYIGPQFYFSACHWHQRRVVVVDHHHHHRFYDSRSVAHYSGARHWDHNPVHRRGVAYYDNRTRERYHSTRESYGASRQYRDDLRGGQRAAVNGNYITSNRARDQRPNADEHLQRLDRRQAGQITQNSANVSNERADRLQNQRPRDEQLRERMNSRSGRDGGNMLNRTHTASNNQQSAGQGVDVQQAGRRIQTGQQENRWDNRATNGDATHGRASADHRTADRTTTDRTTTDRITTDRITTDRTTTDRTSRVERVDNPRAGNNQITRMQLPRENTQNEVSHNNIQRSELPRFHTQGRSEQIARVDRPIERSEAPRAERVEHIDRSERIERANSDMHTSGGRAEMRGGRER